MTGTEKKDAIAQRYYTIRAEWGEFAREAAQAEKKRTVFVDYPLKPKEPVKCHFNTCTTVCRH